LLIAPPAPDVQIVGAAGLQPLRINGVGAAQFKRLPVGQVLSIAVGAGYIHVVRKVGEDTGVVVRKHIHAQLAALIEAGAAVRRADIESLTLPQPHRMNVRRALCDAE
jgi:hypothetical protein